MLHIKTGQITIDGKDISEVSRDELRKRINCIPQEQIILPGSSRDNLDPLHNADDEHINAVLGKLSLGDWLGANGGLDADMNADTLSHAQKRMFSLARALLRPGQIVLVDEVSSRYGVYTRLDFQSTNRFSMELKSEELVRRLIFGDFADRTVLATTHDLASIRDYDVVLVLDRGRLAEIGSPQELLQDPNSLLRRNYQGHDRK